MTKRVVAFVDGFNLYHAIDDLGQEHLKWVDLRTLALEFAPAPHDSLERVLYFTAYATWLKPAWARHRAYTSALRASGVEVMLSKFKKKQRRCALCQRYYRGHEEKETDVSIGVHLLDLAHRDEYDRALLVSGDSDLCPAVKLVRERYPEKEIVVLTPPGRRTTKGLADATGIRATRMKSLHVERSLLPETVFDADGNAVAVRPAKYDPP